MPGKNGRRNHVLTVMEVNVVGEETQMSLALQQPAPLHRVRVRTPGKHIVAFCAAALAMVAGAIYVAGVLASRESGKPAARAAAMTKVSPEGVALGEFLVDLAPDRTGRAAYMRLALTVRGDAEAAAGLKAREAEARERIAFLLRGLSADDLVGEEGMTLVKREALRRINLVIAPAEAEDVAITDMIVQ